ncbi:MAG: lipopolysaccharide biosynthesis protein [Clostridia bacterium]|nr:lipopolysaccharide biosynthesis protein [Clostridia bacterium]
MINILFGGNYKVFDGILLTVLSAIKHCDAPLNIYILTADLSDFNPEYKPIQEKDIELLNTIIKEKNSNSNVTRIVIGDEFNNWATNSKNHLNQYTPFAFLRLFADKIDLPEKVIYLDSDVMFNGNIKHLFDVDISKHELGVVKDRYGRWFINPNYFNSGVLLMNMKNIKKTNLLQKVRDMCFSKKMAFPDQTSLNKCCKNKIYLPRKFNEQGNPKKDTIIQHFSKRIVWFPFHTINIKQYHFDQVQQKYKIHIYDDIFETYKRLK